VRSVNAQWPDRVLRPFNVLLSSAGRRVALVELFRRSLRELGMPGAVIASDMSRLSAAFHAADRAVQVAPCENEQFVPDLIELCRKHAVRLVVPTIDTELAVLAAHRDRFAAIGTTVVVSDPETIAICADKERTHVWLEHNGFPTVRQTTAIKAIEDPDGWPLPLIIKPRWGSASIGVRIARNRHELELASGLDLIAQTLAPGAEYTVDVLVDGTGRAVCAVPRRRLEVRAGEVSKGVTVRRPTVEQLMRQMCETFPGAYGPVTIQVFLDDVRGEARIIEINPRFGGGFPLSWEAGARFPRWLIEEVAGIPSTAETNGWRDGLVMLRYDDAVFVDAREVGLLVDE
jgi:carbamoyl-phosphate synthase large subunit